MKIRVACPECNCVSVIEVDSEDVEEIGTLSVVGEYE